MEFISWRRGDVKTLASLVREGVYKLRQLKKFRLDECTLCMS